MSGPDRNRSKPYLACCALFCGSLLAAGRGAPAPVFVLLVIGAVASLGALLWNEARAPSIAPRTILLVSAGLMVLAIAIPPRASRDVYAYVMYGRVLGVHHANPYRHSPAEFPNDPALQRMASQFRTVPSVYGPAFAVTSAAITVVAGDSQLAQRVGFQALAAVAVGATLLIMRRRGAGTLALAAVGLNPLVVSIVSGGHNDALVGLAVLGGIALLRRSPGAAGVALGLGACVKITALLPAGAVGVWLLVRDRRRGVALAASCAAVVLGGYALFGGISALEPLRSEGRYLSRFSIWHLVPEHVGGFLRDRATIFGARVISFAGTSVAIASGIVVAFAYRRASSPMVPAALATSALLLAMPYILPWYIGAVFPLLVLDWRRLVSWLAPIQTMLLFLWYPRIEPQPSGEAVEQVVRAGPVIVGVWSAVALAVLLVSAVREWRRTSRTGAALPSVRPGVLG